MYMCFYIAGTKDDLDKEYEQGIWKPPFITTLSAKPDINPQPSETDHPDITPQSDQPDTNPKTMTKRAAKDNHTE